MLENFGGELSRYYACAHRHTRAANLCNKRSVINDRIRLSGGIGRVIKCEQALPRGIAFQCRKEPAVLTDVRL